MALQKLLSQLRHRGLGSSSAVRSGIQTSVHKSALLLPGMLQRTEDFHTLPLSAPWNHSLQSGNQCGAAHSERLWTGSGEEWGSFRTLDITGDDAKEYLVAEANGAVGQSLVCLAVRRGDETLALGSGTIIRSDGIVVTSASPLSPLKIEELKATVNVKVMDRKAIYETVLLDVDFSSNIAFLKIMSPRQHVVPKFAKLDNLFPWMLMVAAGCNVHSGDLQNAKAAYSLGQFSSVASKVDNAVSRVRTSGQVINAKVDETAPSTGGPLLHPGFGVYGVIHYDVCGQIEATPMDDVLKYLDHFQKHGEHPKSVSCSV